VSSIRENKALSDFAVLILAYRRAENIEMIAKNCIDYGLRNLFIHIDGAESSDPKIFEDQKAINGFLTELKTQSNSHVQVLRSARNKGIAVSVITACDWVFSASSNKFIIVLEDDCIPTSEFFDFCLQYADYLQRPRNLILCGTNPSPIKEASVAPILSHYSLTWGWMTSRENWSEIRHFYFINPIRALLSDLFSIRKVDCYWNAGYRRAIQGVTDVWDTVLVRSLRKQSFFALLPPSSLVSNIGDDQFATHTKPGSQWTLSVSNPRSVPFSEPKFDLSIDNWLEHNVFQIRVRHIFTTKFTLLTDIFTRRKRRFGHSLPKRLTELT